MYRTNVAGTRALLVAAAAAGVRRIDYTSSIATLGLAADGSPADETTPVAVIAEAMARLRRSGEPLVTSDDVRMAQKRMYFSSAKAEREPAEEALRNALDWYRGRGDLRRPG